MGHCDVTIVSGWPMCRWRHNRLSAVNFEIIYRHPGEVKCGFTSVKGHESSKWLVHRIPWTLIVMATDHLLPKRLCVHSDSVRGRKWKINYRLKVSIFNEIIVMSLNDDYLEWVLCTSMFIRDFGSKRSQCHFAKHIKSWELHESVNFTIETKHILHPWPTMYLVAMFPF